MATFTIFDGDPNQSGPANWPDWTDLELVSSIGDTIEAAKKAATECGEYTEGDQLWMLVYNEDGSVDDYSFRV